MRTRSFSKNKGALVFIRKRLMGKTAIVLMVCFLGQIIYPTTAWALTSGPGQPEFSSFEPASTTDMVDAYSGDFTYNIPLLSVPGPNGGYPINLAYQSGLTMDQEASWVGLGWNLNVGAVNRAMRGIPDDFNGEEITHTYHMRPEWTASIDLPLTAGVTKEELFGFTTNTGGNAAYSASVYYNSFRGLGTRFTLNGLNKIPNLPVGLSVSFDSQNGVGITPSLSMGKSFGNLSFGLGISASINNRSGLQSVGFSTNATKTGGYCGRNTSYSDLENATTSMSSGLNFATSAFVPSVSMPVKTTTVPFSMYYNPNVIAPTFGHFKVSSWSSPQFTLSGYFTTTDVKDGGIVSTAAYGYLNTQNSSASSMVDYTPGNFEYSKKTPYIAPGSYTYDVFSLTGQGVAGMFRAQRGSVDALHDATLTQTSHTFGVGFEFGTGSTTTTHVGVDLEYGQSNSTSGDWNDGTSGLNSNLHFSNTTEKDYEHSFFKMYGEHTGDYYSTGGNTADDQWTNWYEDKAVRVKLEKTGGWLERSYQLGTDFIHSETQSGGDVVANGDYDVAFKNSRQKRATHIQKLTNNQAELYGLERPYYFVPDGPDAGTELDSTGFTFNNSYQRDNHISEISSTQPDGTMYVYGLPVYNKTHTDVNTSVPDADRVGVNGEQRKYVDITSTSHTNNTTNGSKTRQFLDKTEMPSYVSGWLLTSVRGADYADVTNNGVSDDDLGYWARFSYYKPLTSDFTWRTPYKGAIFNNGSDDSDLDNTAYYSYGTKEVYYVRKIETKTHVAVFYISPRKDGREAISEYVSTSTNVSTSQDPAYKLDSIKLFVRAEYQANKETATCIQGVHFRYDYSLCRDVENNDGAAVDENGNSVSQGSAANINANKGKLTLKRVFFTYQKSKRGELSPYRFDYSSINPAYNQMNMDRWGNYFNQDSLYANGGDVYYPYLEFPYGPQDDDAGGQYEYQHFSSAWSLSEITLPTGGKIKLRYESDDYAYVEDQPAMQMFDIVKSNGTGDDRKVNWTDTTLIPIDNDEAFSYSDGGSETDYFKIYFKLNKPYPGGDDATWVRNNLIKGATHIWFKTHLPLTNSNTSYDYVSGYAELAPQHGSDDMYGVTGSNLDIAYVSVKAVDVNALGVFYTHPFRKAAYQYLKMNRPERVFNLVEPTGNWVSQVGSIGNSVINQITGVAQTLLGYYLYCQTAGFSSEMMLNGRSIVRLYEPDGKKFGGGSRIKSLKLHDNWLTQSGNDDLESVYGQEYFYDVNGDGTGTSTGVAYEPATGAEESALRQPVPYTESNFASSAYALYVQKPLMESYYPGPSVGYSKVTVKSVAPSEADRQNVEIENSAAPYVVHEFYTPKDFPIVFDETDMNTDPSIVRPVFIPGVYTSTAVRQARSQGFSIVLNDMAGKPKKMSTYKRFPGPDAINGIGQNLISSQEYVYQTEDTYNPNGKNVLDNRVQALVDFDSYKTAVIGQTFDVFIARNENRETSFNAGLQMNFDLQATPPLFSFIPIPNISETETSMKTVVTHKIIHRSGILKETIVTTDQSTIKTENLAYDIHTGQPLLTKVTNEFKDPIYSYSYPAHWYYNNMGAAYTNSGLSIEQSDMSFSSGTITFTSGITNMLNIGDYAYLTTTGSGAGNFHVHVRTISGNTVWLVDENGNAPTGSTATSFYVIQSGRKNMLTASCGAISATELTGLSSAYTGSGSYDVDNSILNASAIEFSDGWKIPCYDCEVEQRAGNTVNVFRVGLRNMWRPRKSYAYVTDRLYADNSRTDGLFDQFEKFNWADPSGADDKWISAATITKYSPFGFELENKDALGVYSAAHYGYRNSLVTAIGKNTRYIEMMFDGFEYQGTCEEGFYWTGASPLGVTNYAHTGKRSYKVLDNDSLDQTITFSSTQFTQNCEDTEMEEEGDATNLLGECNCLGTYNINPSTDYYISAWAREVNGSAVYTNYTAPEIHVYYKNSGGTIIGSQTITTDGRIIEKWQRLGGKLEIPATATSMIVSLNNTGTGTTDVYFDDLRIHPFKSNMVSYVYDPVTFRLMAELDAQNYATFYIYDEAGHLNKIKKETREGIKTIKEGRISNFRSHE